MDGARKLVEIEPATAAERHRIQQSLRESEERFRLAFEEAPIGMALVGLDGRFLRGNRALCAIVGYGPDELVARTFHEITHPDDVDIDDALARKLASGEIPSYQLAKRYIRKDGSVVDVMLSGSIVREANGAPLYFLAQVEDITARLRAEEALRRSEAQLRELIEQAPEAVFIAGLDGLYTSVNGAAGRLLGYEPEELIGKSIVDVLAPEDVPRLAVAKERLADGTQTEVSDWNLRRKDGVLVPVEVSAKIHSDGRWVAFVRDMSERRRSEEALRHSEESLTRAQRVARLGSWEWDIRTNEVQRSNELFALFGLPPGATAPQRWSLAPYVHPDDRERVNQIVDDAVREGRSYVVEHRIVRADGVERIMVQQGEPILEGGRPVRMVGTMLDVTERRQAQLEREATLRWLRAVFENSPVALLLIHGRTGLSVDANGRAKELLGRPLARVGEFPDMVLAPNGAPIPDEQLPARRALRGERIEASEYMIQRPDGTRIPVLAGAAPILDTGGDVTGAVVAFQDIVATKELERLRAEWSSVVAHDLRQPLHTMSLYAQFIERNTTNTETRDAVQRIRAAGHRLNRMIADLMDLSRLDARRLELTLSTLDIGALVRDSLERFELEAPERSVIMRFEGDTGPVRADPDRIAQILDNLLSNALKYSTPGTPIEVTVEGKAGEVAVAVTNEGRGIAAEELPSLFKRFQRAADVRRTKIKGIGLGLYITHELVEAHGGRLSVESTPGAKTTFRFTLPTS